MVAWVFGREFSDGTVRYLLALPTSRTTIIAAKLAMVAIWCAALTALITLLGLAVGGPWTCPAGRRRRCPGTGAHLGGRRPHVADLTPLALLAGVGRGYLAPLGFAMLVVILAQVVGATGRGAYFPWAIPALYARSPARPAAASRRKLRHRRRDRRRRLSGTFAWWLYADFPR